MPLVLVSAQHSMSSVHGILQEQEYWSGLPRTPPDDLPDPGIKPTSHMSPALAGRFFITSATWEAPVSASAIHNCEMEYILLHPSWRTSDVGTYPDQNIV